MTLGGQRAARAGAGKRALIGLTRSFALILQNDSITVDAVCPGCTGTRQAVTDRENLTAHAITIADAAHVATAAVLDFPATGQSWEVQPGRPTTPAGFPDITLHRAVKRTNRAPATDDLRVPERRTS